MSSDSENSNYDGSDSSVNSGDEIEELGLQPYQFEPEYSSEEELQNDEPVEQHENNENRLENSAW